GVRNVHQFQQPLHRAIFTIATMQDDEGAIEPAGKQLLDQALGRIHGMRVDAAGLQRAQHGAAALQRNLALRRGAAEQHRDLAETLDVMCRHSAAPSSPGSSGASAPMSPAPSVITRSPSRRIPRNAAGTSRRLLTNTGSMRPRLRM